MAGTLGRLVIPVLLGDTDALDQEARRAGEGAAGAASEGAVSGAKKMAKGLSIIGTAAAGAAAAAFVGAFNQAMEKANLQGTIMAQLGVDPAEAKAQANLAGKLYAQGWGESLTDVNTAITDVKRNLQGVALGAGIDDLTKQALTLADAFGQDITGAAAAAAQMVRTGLAPNAQVAFDIIARGLQNGANKADDLLEVFTEYGTQFRKLGLDGKEALGLIQQGLQAGARDADIVADAVKEFSIRSVDGSKATSDAYKGLGLDANKMAAQIAKGGPAAQAGLQTVLDRLRAVKDPAKRAQLAVALFGTQAEDLGQALYALNPATATSAKGMDGISGAAKRVADNNKAAIPTFETFKRQAIAAFGDSLDQLAPLMVQLVPLIPTLTKVTLGIAAMYAAVKAGQVVKTAATPIVNLVRGFANIQTGASGAAGTMGRLGAAMRANAAAAWLMVRAGVANAASLARQAAAATVARIQIIAHAAAARISAIATAAWTAITNLNIAAHLRAAVAWVVARVAMIAGTIATVAATVAQWALNIAMMANPIGLIILAIIALIAIIVLIATKTTWFQDIWAAVWGWVSAAAVAVWNWLKGVFTMGMALLQSIVSAGWNFIVGWFLWFHTTVVGIILGVWNWISVRFQFGMALLGAIIQTGWNFIVGLFNWFNSTVIGIVSAVWSWISSRFTFGINLARSIVQAGWNRIVGLFRSGVNLVRSIVNGISGIFTGMVNGVRSGVNRVINIIRRFRIPGFSIPSPTGGTLFSWPGYAPFSWIPNLAEGGTIMPRRGGTLVNVAEAGRAESVVDTGLLNKKLAEPGNIDYDRLATAIAAQLAGMQWTTQIDPQGVARLTALGNLRNGRRR